MKWRRWPAEFVGRVPTNPTRDIGNLDLAGCGACRRRRQSESIPNVRNTLGICLLSNNSRYSEIPTRSHYSSRTWPENRGDTHPERDEQRMLSKKKKIRKVQIRFCYQQTFLVSILLYCDINFRYYNYHYY